MDDAEKVVAALNERCPGITGPKRDDICYATQNRQDAVKALAKQTDIVFVVGSKSSSNSNRLREVAELLGTEAHLIDNAEQIDPVWLKEKKRIGVTAGASAPEILVKSVVDKLTIKDPNGTVQLPGVSENVIFALPRELQ